MTTTHKFPPQVIANGRNDKSITISAAATDDVAYSAADPAEGEEEDPADRMDSMDVVEPETMLEEEEDSEATASDRREVFVFDQAEASFDPAEATFDPKEGTFDPAEATFDPAEVLDPAAMMDPLSMNGGEHS